MLAGNGNVGVCLFVLDQQCNDQEGTEGGLASNGDMGVCLLVVDQQRQHGCVLAGC